MADLSQVHLTGQLPGGVAEADADLFTSVGVPRDWSHINPGQSGIVVRNTFIDVCPLEEESGSDNDTCASPPQRRNLSAPPSPTRNRNPWANEDTQYIDSDQEEEEDPSSIPNYQWAPEGGLLTAQEQNHNFWPPIPPASPKKIPGKKRQGIGMEADGSNHPLLGDFLKEGVGMKLAGMHGFAAEPASGSAPLAPDPYAAFGLAPATGSDAGSRFSGTEFSAGLPSHADFSGGLPDHLSRAGGGLGAVFGQGVGLPAETLPDTMRLGAFGAAPPPSVGSLDRQGLSTMPLGPGGYPLADGFSSSSGGPGLGVPGPNILSGFDAVGMGSLNHGMPPIPDPLLGLSGTGLGGYGGGFGQLNRDGFTDPNWDLHGGPPPAGPALGLSSQVLSNERLSTAPTLSTAPPPSSEVRCPTPEPTPCPSQQPVQRKWQRRMENEASRMQPTRRQGGGNDQLAPGAAYISDNPPPRTPLAGHIPTEAPAYVLGTTSGASHRQPHRVEAPPAHGPPAPFLSSTPPVAPVPAEQAAGSRMPSGSAKGKKGNGKGGFADLKGVFGGMATEPTMQDGQCRAGGQGGGGWDQGPLPFPPFSGLGTGDAADRCSPPLPASSMLDEAGNFMSMEVGGPSTYTPMPQEPAPPPSSSSHGGNPCGSHGPWIANQASGHGPWVAGGAATVAEAMTACAQAALRSLEGLGDGPGGPCGRGSGERRGGRSGGRGDGAGAAGAALAAGEAKGRVPLSGGGPKRTDYIKKYGGVPEGDIPGPVPITTMMLKNIPCRKSQDEVMMHIDQKGFSNRYDFFYLPRDVKFRANLGYAFINFLTPEDASNFSAEMNGYKFSSSGSMKACAVVPAHVQGLMNNLAAFKRTEVMRSSRRPYFSSMTNL